MHLASHPAGEARSGLEESETERYSATLHTALLALRGCLSISYAIYEINMPV